MDLVLRARYHAFEWMAVHIRSLEHWGLVSVAVAQHNTAALQVEVLEAEAEGRSPVAMLATEHRGNWLVEEGSLAAQEVSVAGKGIA